MLQIGTIIRVRGEERPFLIVTERSKWGIWGAFSMDGYFCSFHEDSILREEGYRELTPDEEDRAEFYRSGWRTK